MTRFALTCSCAAILAAGCVGLESENLGSTKQAVTSSVSPEVIDCATEYANHAGTAAQGRVVSWKYNNFQDSGGSEDETCTYGWCGPNSSIAGTRGGCVSGDDLETDYGYQFGACNSSAWGQRFRASLGQVAGGVDPDFCGDSGPTKCTGTTTFGYHPYWEIDYNGTRRTYQGWSYEQHPSELAAYATTGGTTSCPDAGISSTTALSLTVDNSAGADQYFTMVVPAGDFGAVIRTSGANGDADLLVRWGADPTFNSLAHDCKSDEGGTTDEVCAVHGSGTLHILVHQYSAYGSLSLSGSYDSFGGGGGSCTPSCSGDMCGQDDGCGGTCSDADLGSCGMCGLICNCTPSCSGDMCGQDDGCGNACSSADAQTCGLCGNQACGGGGSCDSVTYSASNTSSASFSDADTVQETVNLTAGVAYSFSTCGTTTTDTYLRLHSGSSQQVANDDGCGQGEYQSSFNFTPGSTGAYVLSMGCYNNNRCDATVNISPAADSCGGGGGNSGGDCETVDESGLSGGAGTELRYTIVGTDVAAALAGGSGDADLYIRRGAAPTTSSYDCRSNGYNNNESCSVGGSGTFHIMVRGYDPFSAANLTADVASCN